MHIMNKTILSLSAFCAIMAGAALLEGPSDADLAMATAADLMDARDAATVQHQALVACKAKHGKDAVLVDVLGFEGQVCRKKELKAS
jgi:hypothetical protein